MINLFLNWSFGKIVTVLIYILLVIPLYLIGQGNLLAARPWLGHAPLVVNFYNKPDPPPNGLAYLEVDFGDGSSTILCTEFTCAQSMETRHEYADPGIYKAVLILFPFALGESTAVGAKEIVVY
jgi:PKD repeat protein